MEPISGITGITGLAAYLAAKGAAGIMLILSTATSMGNIVFGKISDIANLLTDHATTGTRIITPMLQHPTLIWTGVTLAVGCLMGVAIHKKRSSLKLSTRSLNIPVSLPTKQIIIILAVIVTYLAVTIPMRGVITYLLPSLLWGIVAFIAIRTCTMEKLKQWYNKKITRLAILIGTAQLSLIVYMGIFHGYGKSPLSFAPTMIILNLIMISTALIGIEFSRGYLTKTFGKRKPILTILLIGLLYAVIATPMNRFGKLDPGDPLGTTKFLGTGILPTITQSLLATYLALLGGPLASLAYLAPLKGFEWFSPILPDLPWGIKALIGVMAPAIGFLLVDRTATPKLLRRLGLPGWRAIHRPQKPTDMGWIAIPIIGILVVWSATGLLGFRPTVIGSGSMRPTMDVGDLVVSTERSPEKIREGDIIQFWTKESIIHRVVEVHNEAGQTYFVTKGEANNAPDRDPVNPGQIMGKVVLTIPKVGWLSIWTKKGITLSSNNAKYLIPCLLAGSILGAEKYRRHRNDPIKKLKRRLAL